MKLKAKKLISLAAAFAMITGSFSCVPVSADEKNDDEIIIAEAAEGKEEDTSETITEMKTERPVLPDWLYDQLMSEYDSVREEMLIGGTDSVSEDLGAYFDTDEYYYKAVMNPLTPDKRKEVDARADYIVSQMGDNWTELQKAVYLHDVLCEINSYDFTFTNGYADGALLEGTSICNGYTHAYWLLCYKAGLECCMVGSTTLKHIWNLVKIDGEWYMVDVTWDDSDRCYGHEYFLCCDSSFGHTETDQHVPVTDWKKSDTDESGYGYAVDTKYDRSFFRNTVGAAPVTDNYVYYYDKTQKALCKATRTLSSSVIVPDVTARNPWGAANLALYNGRLYYTDKYSLLSCRTDGSDIQTVYELSSSEQAAYTLLGFDFLEGVLKLKLNRNEDNTVVFGYKKYDFRGTVPSNLTANAYNGKVVLNWTGTPVNKYSVYYKSAKEANYSLYSVVDGETSCVCSGLDNDVTYSFKVAAYGSSDYSDTVSAAPSDPIGLMGAAKNQKVILSWKKVNGAKNYYVYIHNGKNWAGYDPVEPSKTTFSISGLDNDKEYKFKLLVEMNGEMPLFSEEITVTPVSLCPLTGFKARPLNGKVELTWDKLEGASEYHLYRSENKDEWGGCYTIDTNSYLNEGLTNGKTYYYKVCAVIGDDTSDMSPIISAVPTAAYSITGFKAEAKNQKVILTWDKLDGASEYHVYCSEKEDEWGGHYTVTENSFTNSGLTNGKTYYYKVCAVIGDDTSDMSPIISAVPTAKYSITGFKAEAKNQKIILTWDKLEGASEYHLYRSEKEDEWGGHYTITENSYSNGGLTNGKTYYYKICAVIGDDTSAMSPVISAVPSALSITGLKAETEKTSVTLSWDTVAGATEYRVFRSLTPDEWGGFYRVYDTTFTNTGLTVDTIYYYRVCAVFGDDVTDFAEISAETKSAAPTGLTAMPGNGMVKLSWNKLNSGCYYIEYKKSTDTEYKHTWTYDTYITLNNLENGAKYDFRVRSYWDTLFSGVVNAVPAENKVIVIGDILVNDSSVSVGYAYKGTTSIVLRENVPFEKVTDETVESLKQKGKISDFVNAVVSKQSDECFVLTAAQMKAIQYVLG